MPTGYTAAIEKGLSFESFVWQCARGMGALVRMRDDPWDAPVPERFEPSGYYIVKREAAEAELAAMDKMSDDEASQKRAAEYVADVQRAHDYEAGKVALKAKYEAMLQKVLEWQPPSKDHIEFKSFMIQQIKESIRFDCDPSYVEKVEHKDFRQWKQERIARLQNEVKRCELEYAKDVERTEASNRWIADLRKSLEAKP